MTKEDKFEIGLTLNKIAMLLSDDDFQKVKDLLKHIEQIIAEQSEADTPQTDSEITRNSLRTDCNGCRFVGTYDTEFPCANCTRKNKDYYDADTSQTDCAYREYPCDMCDEQTDCQWK
jgi:hypothetical protein